MLSWGLQNFRCDIVFNTWAEGAVPTTVFEFLSDTTARQDRHEKVTVYLQDMGVQEYFIHQPDTEKPEEFRGWQRRGPADIVEIEPDASGALFSEALNLRLQWEYRPGEEIRLLRPYLPRWYADRYIHRNATP